jgi:hypothetical protein
MMRPPKLSCAWVSLGWAVEGAAGDGGGIIYLAADWAQRKAPVRFTSMILRHCEGGVERLGMQPTMPAKQSSMEIWGLGGLEGKEKEEEEEEKEVDEGKEDEEEEEEEEEEGGVVVGLGVLRAMAASCMMMGTFSEVTSQGRSTMRAAGKSERRSWMAGREAMRVDSRSRRATPLAPCSRRARAVARARTPAPPVMTAFPLTAKRARARLVGESEGWSGGGGAVRGLEESDNVIIGRVRKARASRSEAIPRSPMPSLEYRYRNEV